MSLDNITTELGEHYRDWKGHEKIKEDKRKEFFDATTKEEEKKTLARKTVRVDTDTKEEAWELASRYNSKWKVLDIESDNDGWIVILEEDPAFKIHVHINRQDGYVYTKSVSDAGAILDTERIQDKDPELWEEITEIPTERILRPLEDLSEEAHRKLQEYTYKPKPQVKLLAPRKAKAEELEDANNNS